MAKSATGKWVSRVGSSGGGKAYRRSRPSNFIGILVVIVVLGGASAVLARYDYEHPPAKAAGPAPKVGTTWYAGLAIQACGKTLPDLTGNTTSAGGLTIAVDDVIQVKPVSSADSGNNATLGQFSDEYPGLVASSTELAIPTSKFKANTATTYHNGDLCPTGSKYAGQKGVISYSYWTSFGQKKPVTTSSPSSIKFAPDLRVTMAFDPAGVSPAPPSEKTGDEMSLLTSTPTTTSTVPSVTTTTVAGVTTTTLAPSTTTTLKG